jgi:hypothetical protein
MNLTKEYFDKALKNLATKDDLKKLATKDELAKQTQLLMAHTADQIEGLARMIEAGFQDVQERLDVKERVGKLERELKKIKEALQV